MYLKIVKHRHLVIFSSEPYLIFKNYYPQTEKHMRKLYKNNFPGMLPSQCANRLSDNQFQCKLLISVIRTANYEEVGYRPRGNINILAAKGSSCSSSGQLKNGSGATSGLTNNFTCPTNRYNDNETAGR